MSRVHVAFDKAGEVVEYDLLPARRRVASPDDDLELAALCGLAWEHRHDEAELRLRVAAIDDWHDRRHIRAYERRLRSRAAVLQVLRETNPQRAKETA